MFKSVLFKTGSKKRLQALHKCRSGSADAAVNKSLGHCVDRKAHTIETKQSCLHCVFHCGDSGALVYTML